MDQSLSHLADSLSKLDKIRPVTIDASATPLLLRNYLHLLTDMYPTNQAVITETLQTLVMLLLTNKQPPHNPSYMPLYSVSRYS